MCSLTLSAKRMSKLSWGVSAAIGLALLYYVSYLHGIGKLQADPGLLAYFTDTVWVGMVGLYLSGIAEVFGPLLLLHWRTAFYGALLLLINFVVASYVVWSGGGTPTETGIYVVLALLVGWLMRPDILRARGEITKITV